EAFKQNLNRIANRAEFSNATRVLIREIEQNLPKSVESGGTQANMEGRGLQSQTQGAGQELEGRGLQDQGAVKIPHNPAFGQNFKEFYHDPKGAIAKLIETKEGQVAGAFYREDLGDIDLVWGNSKMGLAHILERRTQQYGEEKALKFIQELPRMVQESKIYENSPDKVKLITPKEIVVIGKRDQNRFIITGFNDRKNKNRFKKLDNLQILDDAGFADKSVSEQPKKVGDILLPNQEKPTTPPLKSQEPKLLPYKPTSEIYKEAKAKGLSYAEFKALKEQNKRLFLENTTIPKSTAEVIKEAKALGLKADEAIKAIKQNQKASLAGLKENERPLEIGQAIPMQKLNGYSSSISLDDTHIYPLDLVVVKTTDVKPNMQAKSGVQTRTQTDLNKVAEIANNFKPEYVINRGGFDDLPIIIQDGQVIVGNHRALGMQEFSTESRKAYEQAIENTYGLKLKQDELLVRTPKETLTDKELINLASASNKERTTTFGDRLIAAIGKYDEYITPQNLKVLSLESSDVEESALRVAKMLDKQAKAPDIEATNLALLAHSARNNRTSLSEALDFAQKHLDQLEFTRLKDMFVKNAGGLYTFMNHPRLENLHLSPYLSKTIEDTAKALKNTRGKNFTILLDQIETLLKTTDDQGLNAMVKSMSPVVYDDLVSSLLGASLARFAQLENPASGLYEFLKYAPRDLEQLVAPNMAKMMQGIEGKPLSQANIFDFVHLAIASGETSQATSKVLDLLPALEKKALAAKNALKDNVEIQALNQAQARSATEKSALASIDQELSHEEIKQLQDQEIVSVSYAKWMQAFNLKNTNEPFIPKFAPEVKQALESVLQGEDIKLTQGSLYKLVKRDRSGLIDYIRPTLESPNMVLDDGKGLLFIKEFIDPDKNRYFMSVAKNYNGEWIFSTHTRKALSAIKNKVNNSKILYNAGFKSGEVASASDILESGGTAMKPSDLQINTPPHPSSGLNPEKKISQESLKNQEIPFEQLNQRMIKPEEFTDSVIKELKKRPKL
ncbi:PBECR2 nuclease fold domain-containing protein, partial [Helicobacter suis]|uniref:putative barnase/colicin E5 family endoribonuclease n=1 Tax=Helicobacter suis TaxID=104628 RepID=UPI0013D5CF40